MATSSRGGRAVSALLGIGGPPRICSHCAKVIRPAPFVSRRLYSEASSVIQPPTSGTAPPPPPPAEPTTGGGGGSSSSEPQPSVSNSSPYAIKAGIILSRAPLLTRDPTPFEAAFYLYQKRLNERLTSRFRPTAYFKQDTPPALDWALKHRERNGVAGRDIGRYNPVGRLAWNDEVLVGSRTSDPGAVRDTVLRDAVMRISEDGEVIPAEERAPVETVMARRTEADEKGDVRRLDRALDRTLYLVVKTGKEDGEIWQFPTTHVRTEEALHESAKRVLEEAAGVNMNTWLVGRVPVAHHTTEPYYRQEGRKKVKEPGQKIFFLKGRIMAGQADLKGNKLGLTDFMWLTREELKEYLPEPYYLSAWAMMSDR